MKSFITFLDEAAAYVGKHMGHDTWVHKDFIDRSRIPADVHAHALAVLNVNHPNFRYDVVKHNKVNNNISFIRSPDFDTAAEPQSGENVMVKSDGSTKYNKANASPSIWHQKHEMTGPEYTGFDRNKSIKRAVDYKRAIAKLVDEQGVTTKYFSGRIGRPDFWNREVVPHIKED